MTSPHRPIPARSAAALLLALALSGCGNHGLPKIEAAKPAVEKASLTALHDPDLAAKLESASTTPVAAASDITSQILLALQAQMNLRDWKGPVQVDGGGRSWQITFDQSLEEVQGDPEWSPGWFDRLYPASAFPLENYLNIHSGPGAGVPVVLAIEDLTALRRKRSFRPENNLYVGGTAILDFSKPASAGRPTPVRLRIINTANQREWTIAGRKTALAWNTTAAVEANLDNPYILDAGLAGLLRPGNRSNATGLFGLSAYDSRKIPVVFVHGLNSDPHIWKSIVNEIHGDPILNSRYLPLLFMYPTGQPVPAAAARLRESLLKYRETWDEDQNDANFERMVLVGHSMGGLLSRLQVIDSGDELWKAFFTRPVAEIPWIPASERPKVESSLTFTALPFVERTVFVAVPHRGSTVADNRIVQFAIRLIKLPKNLADYATTAVLEDPALLNPALLQYNTLGMRSIDMLSPGHPYFKAIDSRPIKVPYHSIIGDRGKGNSPQSADGVVPFWSSYLEGAESVKIVPHGHSCTDAPETIEEILRILHLHSGAGSASN